MTREDLNAFITKQALEYLEDARAWQDRNSHMHDASQLEVLWVSDDGIKAVVDGFRDHLITSAGPEGATRGDFATWIIKEAKVFATFSFGIYPKVFFALIAGFANFVVGKQCLDLGLYARDLQ